MKNTSVKFLSKSEKKNFVDSFSIFFFTSGAAPRMLWDRNSSQLIFVAKKNIRQILRNRT